MDKLQKIIKKKEWYYINKDITEANFPKLDTIRTKNWKLIKMSKSFSSQEALNEIKRQGCTPANAWELATWAKKHRESEMSKGVWSVVLAFGQTPLVDGYHRVSDVYRRADGDFGFDLGDFGDGWGDDCVLLAFCDLPLDTVTIKNDSDSLPLELIINGVKYIKQNK